MSGWVYWYTFKESFPDPGPGGWLEDKDYPVKIGATETVHHGISRRRISISKGLNMSSHEVIMGTATVGQPGTHLLGSKK